MNLTTSPKRSPHLRRKALTGSLVLLAGLALLPGQAVAGTAATSATAAVSDRDSRSTGARPVHGPAPDATSTGLRRRAGDGPKREPSLTGAGRIHYRYSPDDEIRFAFDVHGNTIGARGTFRFSHEIDGTVYRSEAEVDCLVTGGDVATVTGVVTSTDVPDFQDQRVGVTVEDRPGGRDRLGFSWGVAPIPVPQCLGTAPFTKVVGGDYRVVDGPFTVPGQPPSTGKAEL